MSFEVGSLCMEAKVPKKDSPPHGAEPWNAGGGPGIHIPLIVNVHLYIYTSTVYVVFIFNIKHLILTRIK